MIQLPAFPPQQSFREVNEAVVETTLVTGQMYAPGFRVAEKIEPSICRLLLMSLIKIFMSE
jgi:hypothetical protein